MLRDCVGSGFVWIPAETAGLFMRPERPGYVGAAVAELRTDPLTGRSVLVAENRAARPNAFEGFSVVSEEGPAQGAAVCPFCPGQEHLTPPAVHEVRRADGSWQIRVVPNKYPAVALADNIPAADFGELSRVEAASPDSTSTVSAFGAHEVIIESPRHIDRMTGLSAAEVRGVLSVYAARLLHWREDGRLAYGLVFENQGRRAGASLAHLHSQLIALPIIPPQVEAELSRAEADFGRHRSCPYCRLIEHERSLGDRVIYDEDGLIAFCPFASVQPYEVWLMPAEHQPAFETAVQESLERLAVVLHAIAGRVESVVVDGAYNLLVRTAPWRVQRDEWNHWRIELLPRVTALAGFELASGMFINLVAPERAASKLRPV